MFEKFKRNYDEAVEHIESCIHAPVGDDEYEFGVLARWMLTTDVNPYCYLPENWAGATESAEQFSMLLKYLHHALFDDGDVEFVTVNGEPRIVFTHRFDDNFEDAVLSEAEKTLAKRLGKPATIEILDKSPLLFTVRYDEYHVDWLRNCFMRDAERGVEWAAGIYRKYKQWDEAWVEDAMKEKGE